MTPRPSQKAYKSKYRNQPVTVDGIRFASEAEAKRYTDLKLLQRAGEISGLDLQVKFPIRHNGVLICTYVADFIYFDKKKGGRRIVEDKKGFQTREYKLKAKLMKAFYNIEVLET